MNLVLISLKINLLTVLKLEFQKKSNKYYITWDGSFINGHKWSADKTKDWLKFFLLPQVQKFHKKSLWRILWNGWDRSPQVVKQYKSCLIYRIEDFDFATFGEIKTIPEILLFSRILQLQSHMKTFTPTSKAVLNFLENFLDVLEKLYKNNVQKNFNYALSKLGCSYLEKSEKNNFVRLKKAINKKIERVKNGENKRTSLNLECELGLRAFIDLIKWLSNPKWYKRNVIQKRDIEKKKKALVDLWQEYLDYLYLERLKKIFK